MKNLLRAFKKENDTVGRVKFNGRCKKHPKHRQSPGVCSLCLSEKLIQLSSFSSCRRTYDVGSSNLSSSLSSYYSSSSASSCGSPVHCFCFHNEGKGSTNSLSIFLLSGAEHDHNNDKSVNKSGLWFKLLRPKSKRLELVRSMSIPRETITVAS